MQILIKVNKKTLFRIQNGFKLFEEHQIISKYFNQKIDVYKLQPSEIDLISSIFEFLQKLCDQCGKIDQIFIKY